MPLLGNHATSGMAYATCMPRANKRCETLMLDHVNAHDITAPLSARHDTPWLTLPQRFVRVVVGLKAQPAQTSKS